MVYLYIYPYRLVKPFFKACFIRVIIKKIWHPWTVSLYMYILAWLSKKTAYWKTHFNYNKKHNIKRIKKLEFEILRKNGWTLQWTILLGIAELSLSPILFQAWKPNQRERERDVYERIRDKQPNWLTYIM